MPPAFSSTLMTTVSLKFGKITVLLPATKKTTISELKTGFLEALNSTKTRPLTEPLDESSFQLYRCSKHYNNNLDNPPSGSITSTSWDLLADDHSTLSDLSIEEAETLGIGFKNSQDSYDLPIIEIWKEQVIME